MVGHFGRIPFAAGFPGICDPVFQQRLIDGITLAVFSQHFHPHEVILVAIIVVHGKLQRNLPLDQHGGAIDAVMISAPVTHGNSGGPVFDAEGKLIGIVQSGRNDVSAMNYVIPIKTILDFLQEAKDKEDCDF